MRDDDIEQVKPIEFRNYSEFEVYFTEINLEFPGRLNFISPRIIIINTDDAIKFDNEWKIVRTFQSGRVKYQKR